MNFETILNELTPKLNAISRRTSIISPYLDSSDLFQEMSVHLYNRWKKDDLSGYTKSYILQSCWFHMKNYLRTSCDKTYTSSLNEKIDDSDISLLDIMPDETTSLNDIVDYDITVDTILMSDSLTDREKEVFTLTLDGYTTRDIGARLGISFVRVSKIQNNIKKKVIEKLYV